jgi:hypothetical protein
MIAPDTSYCMTEPIKLFDIVALTADFPDRGLLRGQVGTVVELLAAGIYEVEFSDDDGHMYASTALEASQLLPLRYRLQLST